MRRDLFGVRSGAALLSATAALAVGLQSVSAAVTPRQYPNPYGGSNATIGWIGSSLQSTPIGNNGTTANNSFIVDLTNGLKGQFATEVVNPTIPGGGSGKCIAALTARDPAFPVCGSDDPLSVANQTLITAGASVGNPTGTPTQASPIHQVPVLVAPVSVIANLGSAACNGVSLNLRSPILAKIFDGVITSWSDPTIAAENDSFIAGCLSAAGTIKPVVRSDVSGTTYLFKDYLSKRNPEYIALKQDVPAGSAVIPNTTWLTGTAPGSTIDPRDGNTGVVNEVAAVTGAIGYASTAAVGTANVDTAAVDSSNPAEGFQKPASPLCTTAAATVPPMSTLANWSGESFTDSPLGYPICGYSFEFIFNNLGTAYNGAVTEQQAGVALDLVKYALSPAGQAAAFSAANGGFDTIPSAQQTIDDEETQTITYSASPLAHGPLCGGGNSCLVSPSLTNVAGEDRSNDYVVNSGYAYQTKDDTTSFLYCPYEGGCEGEYFPMHGWTKVYVNEWYHPIPQSGGSGGVDYYYSELTRDEAGGDVTDGLDYSNSHGTECFTAGADQHWEWVHHPQYNGDPHTATLRYIHHMQTADPGTAPQGDSAYVGHDDEDEFYMDPQVEGYVGCIPRSDSYSPGGYYGSYYPVYWTDFGN